MKKASLVIEEFYQANKIFDLNDPSRNRDNSMYFAARLRDELKTRGYDLQTNDIHSPHESDLAIYVEMPKRADLFPKPKNKAKSSIILYESDLIRPDNWDTAKHEMFERVFTWNDDLVSRQPTRYIKSNFAYKIPSGPTAVPFAKRKLCTLIAGNKSVKHPLELYTARRDFIRWAEKNIPGEFEYYGVGWEHSYLNGGFVHKVLRRLKLLPYLPVRPSPSYRGKVGEKNPVLSQYRFSICFENGRDIPGYVTEKILDSLFAGCVPVYWGAPNIAAHIPANCFIDFRDFLTETDPFSALAAHMKSMTETRWNQFQMDIAAFLSGEKIRPYAAEPWAEMIVGHVVAL
ncbi:glycosyltransferase family 10 [soil metagenome]